MKGEYDRAQQKRYSCRRSLVCGITSTQRPHLWHFDVGELGGSTSIMMMKKSAQNRLRSDPAQPSGLCRHLFASALFKAAFFCIDPLDEPPSKRVHQNSCWLAFRATARTREENVAPPGAPPILGAFGVCCRHGAHAETFSAGPRPQAGEYFPSANASKKWPVRGFDVRGAKPTRGCSACNPMIVMLREKAMR